MKKIFIFILVTLLFCLLTACSKEGADVKICMDIHNDKSIIRFVSTRRGNIARLENLFGGNSGYTADLIYNSIKDQLIPEQQKLIDGLNDLDGRLKSETIRELNKKFSESAVLFMDALNMLLTFRGSGDSGLLDRIDEKIKESDRLFMEWLPEFQQICRKNGTVFNVN